MTTSLQSAAVAIGTGGTSLLMTETTPCTSPPSKMGMPGLLAVLGSSPSGLFSKAAAQDALHRDASVEVIVMEFGIVKRLILGNLGNFQAGSPNGIMNHL